MGVEFIEKVETQVSNWEGIQNWINHCIVSEGFVTGDVSYVFMSDKELLKFNQDYLNHDYFTDVITFDDSEYPLINGDVLISVDRVLDNCKALKTNYKEEFLRVCVHGVLHLCGYKDKESFDVLQMRSKEAEYLNIVNFEL